MTHYELTSADGTFEADVVPEGDGYIVTIVGSTTKLKLQRGAGQNVFVVDVADKPVSVTLLEASSQRVDMVIDGERISFQRPSAALSRAPPAVSSSASPDVVSAPMPGKVIGALVKKGEAVKAGDPLIILESMKMEVAVRTDRDALVEEILVEDGDSVKRGQGLVRLSP